MSGRLADEVREWLPEEVAVAVEETCKLMDDNRSSASIGDGLQFMQLLLLTRIYVELRQQGTKIFEIRDYVHDLYAR